MLHERTRKLKSGGIVIGILMSMGYGETLSFFYGVLIYPVKRSKPVETKINV